MTKAIFLCGSEETVRRMADKIMDALEARQAGEKSPAEANRKMLETMA